MYPVLNFGYGTVKTAPDPATSGTSLVLDTDQGTRFPDPASVGNYPIVIKPVGEMPTPSNAEVATVTAKSSDTLTITRAAESSSARTVVVGDEVYMAITAAVIKELQDKSSNSFVFNETPGGTVNGSNVDFTLENAPIAGTLLLYRDGQLLTGGGADYTLTDDDIAFVTAPATGSVLLATYELAGATSGNADTLDNQHGSYYAVASEMANGWISAGETWTYASATTITVPSGATSKYSVGDKIKWTQTTVKYAYIVKVEDTVLTICTNDNYAVTDAVISANYYSKAENPQGFPGFFVHTPTWGGFSSDPTGKINYTINGSRLRFWITNDSYGTSNATTLTFTLPQKALITSPAIGVAFVKDNNTNQSTPGHLQTAAGSTTCDVYKTFYGGTWTSSNAKGLYLDWVEYEFTA